MERRGLGVLFGSIMVVASACSSPSADDVPIPGQGDGDGGKRDAPTGLSPVGAGHLRAPCPLGAIAIDAGDDASSILAAAPAGATICVWGDHALSKPHVLLANQRILGIGSNARLSGGAALVGWKLLEPGVWYYDGPRALATPHYGPTDLGGGYAPCYEVSNYADDVFYDDLRMMRVLSLGQLTGSEPLPEGQAVTAGEEGRFFYDYAARRIYVDHDPNGHRLDVAVLDHVLEANGAANVTIGNIVLEKALDAVIEAHVGGQGRSWTIHDSTIRFAHVAGVNGGAGTETARFTYLRDLVTENGRYGISSGGSWQTIQGSEISWNNIANYRGRKPDGTCDGYWGAGATKFVLTTGTATDPGLQVLDLNSHHNIGDGFWTDIHNQWVLVRGGRFHHNERHGYIHEIGCELEITNVELDHNGTPLKNPDLAAVGNGVLISDSNDTRIHDNWIHANHGGGVHVTWEPHTGMMVGCLGAQSDADVSHAAQRNVVTQNTIDSCTQVAGQRGAATIASRNNVFAANRYHVPDTTNPWWIDSTTMSWSDWQLAGHDLGGSVTVGCEEP